MPPRKNKLIKSDILGIRVKNLANFVKKNFSGESLSRSAHNVEIYHKKKHAETGKQNIPVYFVKHFSAGQLSLAEAEAFIGELYYILLDHQAPKVRKICDDSGALIGNISKGLPGYVSLQKNAIAKTDLIKMGLGTVLAACFFLAEDDLHDDNIGVIKYFNNKTGALESRVAKIDHDESFFPVIGDHKTTSFFDLSRWGLLESDKRFPITVEDIIHFPKLTNSQPRYWFCEKYKVINSSSFGGLLGYGSGSLVPGARPYGGEAESLMEHRQFRKDVFKIFFKILLIPEKLIIEIAKSFNLSKEKQQLYLQFFLNRQRQLYNVLVTLPLTKQILQEESNLFWSILQEFNQYNTEYIKGLYPSLTISLRTSTILAYKLYRDVHKQGLMQEITFNIIGKEFLTDWQKTQDLIEIMKKVFSLINDYFEHSLPNTDIAMQLVRSYDQLIYNFYQDKNTVPSYLQNFQRLLIQLVPHKLDCYLSGELGLGDSDEEDLSSDIATRKQIHFNSDYFLREDIASKTNISCLANEIKEWCNDPKNLSSLLELFDKSEKEYKENSWCFQYTNPRDFTNARANLANNPNKLRVVYDILTEPNRGWGEKSFNNKFFELLVKSVIENFKENLYSFLQLKNNINKLIISSQILHSNAALLDIRDELLEHFGEISRSYPGKPEIIL